MLFTSGAYLLLFLPVTVGVYWLAPASARIPVLLAASYVFYLSWHPVYGALLAASTVVNWTLARRIPTARSPRTVLVAGVAFNLLVLGFFKYAGLFTRSAADLAGWLQLSQPGSYDGLQVLLPLAISFFTFEMISVLVDAYRGDVRVGSFLPFAAYKAYFPKLISGPITRYRELVPQLASPAPLTVTRFQSGIALFSLGLFKKLAVANNLALLANPVFDAPRSANAGIAAVGILAFGLQIYFDFSGYTDMARGASRLFGLELPRNFRFPYAANSPSDFWQRWHISLSRWLRDYLYIPLGGNRRGRWMTYRNLMVTMALGGLWHGAAWHFAIWGAIHGLMLSVSHALRGRLRQPGRSLQLVGWVATMIGVFGAWVFFRAHTVGQALDVFGALGRFPVHFSAPTSLAQGATVGIVLVALLTAVAASRVVPVLVGPIQAWLAARPRAATATIAVATVVLWTGANVLARASITPFIYFHF